MSAQSRIVLRAKLTEQSQKNEQDQRAQLAIYLAPDRTAHWCAQRFFK
jgi:hypothetical protein